MDTPSLQSKEEWRSSSNRGVDMGRATHHNFDAKESNTNKPPRMWKCGDPYIYPIPATEGDPWKVLLAPLMEKDKAQCDAWKDEVQNLLIFAGLFSAVVTSFVIQTYQGLQEDPNETIILLLSRISDNLANPLNATNNSESTSQFSPSSSIIRINIYFFISLILSLTTVLVGIVSLQWLREHQAYTGSFTPQNTFAASHMRSEALEKWYVPEVFSALPLLLQLALVLFFIGVIEFLLDINISVVIPVAVVIGLTLVFLIATTVLPTFQAFILHHPYLKINDEVPVQCPYKSPQSRAFRRLITSSKLLFYPLSLTVASIYWVVMRLILLPQQAANLKPCQRVIHSVGTLIMAISAIASKPSKFIFFKIDQRLQSLLRLDSSKSWSGFDYMTPQIYDIWRVGNSFEFDVMWMSIRDNYFQSVCNEDSWLYQHREEQKDHAAIYDATLGLCKEFAKENVNMNADLESPIFIAYHCGINLSSIGITDGVDELNAIRTRNQYIATLLNYDQLTPLGPFPEIMEDVPREVLVEENAFVLLHAAHYKMIDLELSSPRIAQHLAEIYFRLLGYLYSQPRRTRTVDVFEGEPPELELIFSAEELYVMKIYEEDDQPFTTQWALTLHTYFEIWDYPNVDELDFRQSFHTHPFLREYIWNFWKEVDKEVSEHSVHPATLTQIRLTLRLIGRTLAQLLEQKHRHALECMFFPAALYAQICRLKLRDQAILDEAITSLLPVFACCREDMGGRESEFERVYGGGVYDEDQELVLFSEEWWNILFEAEGTKTSLRSVVNDGQEGLMTSAFSTPNYDSSAGLETQSTRTRFRTENLAIEWTGDSIV